MSTTRASCWTDGSVRYACQEADEVYQAAPELATFFGAVTIAAEPDDVRHQLDGDDLETPDGEVWEAPIKARWTDTQTRPSTDAGLRAMASCAVSVSDCGLKTSEGQRSDKDYHGSHEHLSPPFSS
jgi:hypothetical protein